VVGIDHATDVSVGETLACALREDGSAWCWGWDYVGALGLGTAAPDACTSPTSRPDPAAALRPARVAGVEDARQISAGLHAACVLRRTGAVACWGWNTDGQVGDGTTTNRDAPVPVVDATEETSVFSGYLVTCATRRAAAGRCWGLVDNNSAMTPTGIDGLPGNVEQFTGGWEFVCGLVERHVWCWGDRVRPARVL